MHSAECRAQIILEKKEMAESEQADPPPLPGKTQRSSIRRTGGSIPSSRSADPSAPGSAKASSSVQDPDADSSSQPCSPGDLIYSNLGEIRAHLVPNKVCRGSSPGRLPSETSSDSLPPPLPKKQLSRTSSLPEKVPSRNYPSRGASFHTLQHVSSAGTSRSEGYCCSSTLLNKEKPLSSSQSRPPSHPKRYLSKSQSMGEPQLWGRPNNTQPDPFLRNSHLEHLTFTTPDRELLLFFKDLENQATVYEKVMGRQLASLTHLTTRVQEILVGKEEEQQLVGTQLAGKKWADFKLLDKEPCCETGDAWYYRICCAQQVFAAKVHKCYPCSLSIQTSLGVHFNIQQVFGHFIDSLPKDVTPAKSPQKLGQFCPNEQEEDACTSSSPSVSPHLAQVVISPEIPYQTLADFVTKSQHLHSSSPGHYERLACLLLLQLCTGLEYLKKQEVLHYNICPENLLLVHCPFPPQGQQDRDRAPELLLPRLLISNFSKTVGKRRPALQTQESDRVQNTDELQVVLLIYEILHAADSLEKASGLRRDDLPAIPALSVYSQGLQQLATLLLHPDRHRRVSLQQAKNVLQILLWGPRQELFARNPMTDVLLQNWIDIKRTLLLLKFAEKLTEAEVTLSLEEWLCCQYLKEVTAYTLHPVVRILYAV
ncbi:PREDICTED: putative uncharacterized protein C19orf35 homolog isoform X2 [Gavialis gangeticus]|uniref:putative uncharacterized protein C19orf35 homolog isoform X2 n=1 Tax=Gavialis gangeticus TaxID=94835 RepID=UPI00092E3680|nr:PREDICTED: putative uncharacterized protein C19orf35 homolog isoform X2 [Gavialis gangeticus]